MAQITFYEGEGFRGRAFSTGKPVADFTRGGFNDRASSVVVDRGRYENEAPEPLAAPNYVYRRRPNERVYEVKVISVHAVMGQAEQHCWVEREQEEEGGLNFLSAPSSSTK